MGQEDESSVPLLGRCRAMGFDERGKRYPAATKQCGQCGWGGEDDVIANIDRTFAERVESPNGPGVGSL